MISPQQYKKLMKHHAETKKINRSAEKAGISRETARKYVQGGRGPQDERRKVRTWRTRKDEFEEVWKEIEGLLGREPGMEAKTIFREMQRRHPGKFEEGQKRTLERRVREWKEKHGSEPELIFSQEHRPGERMQLDWTHCGRLGVQVGGESYTHLLVHVVFPYSNWEWARVCRSESYGSLRLGMQSALWEIGGRPMIHQTDQSSTATHATGRGKREYNARYLGLCGYYGMEARVIKVGEPKQNGDVESAHGHLKNALEEGLKLRGSRDFATVEAYEQWVIGVVKERNAARGKKVEEEKAVLKELPPERLPEFEEELREVNREGIVRVGKQGYSVPSRWAGKSVRVRIEEERLHIYDHRGEELIMTTAKRTGSKGVYVDWRHVIVQLLRKPGAFARWRHRESMYPGLAWRKLYDSLRERWSDLRAEREYLRLLALGLEYPMVKIEELIEKLGAKASLETVREGLGIARTTVIDVNFGISAQENLASYDLLIPGEAEKKDALDGKGCSND